MNWFMWFSIALQLLILLIFIIPINLKAKIVYDVLHNKGKIQLKLFKLNVFRGEISIEHGFVELTTKKGKKILIPIEVSASGGFFAETDFITILLRKIRLQHGTIYVNFGAKYNAFETAMIVGLVKVIASIVSAVLVTKKSKSKITNKIYPSFTKDQLKVCLKASIKISIMQVLNAYLKAVFEKIKFNKEITQND